MSIGNRYKTTIKEARVSIRIMKPKNKVKKQKVVSNREMKPKGQSKEAKSSIIL
ncbi:hypothetical protein AB1L05_11435 [Cytobacillus horneckiae]